MWPSQNWLTVFFIFKVNFIWKKQQVIDTIVYEALLLFSYPKGIVYLIETGPPTCIHIISQQISMFLKLLTLEVFISCLKKYAGLAKILADTKYPLILWQYIKTFILIMPYPSIYQRAGSIHLLVCYSFSFQDL